ncbi:MAG: hypothetical protein KAR23_06780, partial [Candidatus Aenigmarchaeota archaeon]|nr:hypothetical protein [Candidatus Aenigmarchaeota archaeon]
LPFQFIDEDKARISLNSDLYRMYCVSEVCEKFQHIFKMQVEYVGEKKRINIYFRPKVVFTADEYKHALLEFLNHVIHEEVIIVK